MAIRTLTGQEGYNKKLKKLKSVKVANLDRLRLSMRKEKSRFDRSFMASSDDAADPSVSGTPSPNYMKATSSSSARKGSSQGSTDTRAFARKSNIYGTSGKIPVEIVRQKKSLKRMSSVKQHVNKLSSMKSMKIREKYSQFRENGNIAEEISDGNYDCDQESVVGGGDNQKCTLKRSRSIKLTKLRSKRYSTRMPKTRFGGEAEQMCYGEISNMKPHYMKGTSSHEARKNSAKGLTRMSSWRPVRIIAKIPSLRPRKSRVRKQPEVTSFSRTGVGRATCSSTLKRSEFPDYIELHPGGRESEGTSSIHICPYTYCSLNGLHHHAPSPSLKEFISAKRKSLNNQKGKQLRQDVKHSTNTKKNDQSTDMVSIDIHASQMVTPTLEEKEEDGLDFLVTIYDKPRKKWAVEDSPKSDSTALTSIANSETSETDRDWEQPEALTEISQTKRKQEALNEGQQETHGIFGMCSVEADCNNQQETGTTTSNEPTETFISEEKIRSSGGDLINILSDEQKYTNMWHLIYQQFVPNEGASSANEKGGKNVSTCYEDSQESATENPDFNQTAALKLVQEGLIAILERDADQDMTNSLAGECTLTPEASGEENMKLDERPKKIARSEAVMPRQQMSESYKKLRKIFVTAKIINAMERMKRITPRQPRYLPMEPTPEEENVYLRHLSRKEMKNSEEWMLDHALRWAISRLDPDQQRRVGQLVEAFETVTPGQRERIRHFPTKSKLITTSDLACMVEEESEPKISVPDEKANSQQDDEGLLSVKRGPEDLKETHDTQAKEIDSPLESPENNCKPVYTQNNDACIVNEPMNIPEAPSEFPVGDSNVSHTGEMSTMFFNKQKYTCMWNLIYQHVSSSEASMVGEQGDKVFDEETNGLQSATRSYSTNSKEDEDEQNPTGEYKSDQSAAVKLVKEALDAILKRYEQSSEQQAIPVHPEVASYTDESLRKDSERVEIDANAEGEPSKLKSPPREMSKSYKRLKKAFVTAKFINAIQRLRTTSPRKSQSLPTEAGLNNERVYLRHLSIDGRRSDEECMLDYALKQVISKMTPDKQRRVAQLVKAFETVAPQQKEKSLIGYPSGIETANMAQTVTNSQNQDDGVLLSTEVASRDISLDEDHKATPEGHITLQKTVGAVISETNTKSSPISSISTPDIATEISSIGVKEKTKIADTVSCFTAEGSEVKNENYIGPILSDKRKYTSMWQLIHQQVISSELSKVPTQDFNEVDEKYCQEMKYPNSTHISNMEKVQNDKDSQNTVLNQSAAIKLVKEAIDAILQRHDQRSDQKTIQCNEEACDNGKGHCNTSHSATTEKNSQDDTKVTKNGEKHRNPSTDDNLHGEDNVSVPLQRQSELKAAQRQRKNPNSHSRLKRLFVTAKFIAAMERLRKVNWSKPRYLPPEATAVEEKVYLRHLSIDGTKNHEEWMLDYALRHVISSLAPDQQRKVASLVEAFETVTPEKKGNEFKYQTKTKEEFSPAIKSEPINDEKVIVDSEEISFGPEMQDDRFSVRICTPLGINQQEDCQTDISSIKTELSSEAPSYPVQETPTVRKETDNASLSETSQKSCEQNIGKGLFSDKRKTNGMWHLICQHLQSSSAAEGGNDISERFENNENMKKDDTLSEMTTDADYDDDDDNFTVVSSVTSELTENDAIKLVKETINDILEEPRELDGEFLSSLSTSALQKDRIAEQKREKSQSRGSSKLRQLIICNKFIKTMQKNRKRNPQMQNNLALYSGATARKARLKNNVGEGKDMDEWMLDSVLQKAISGLAPAKQRRVALLVEAFEKVNPDQEEKVKKKPADSILLEGKTTENGNSVFQASQHLSESPDSPDLNLDELVTISSMDSTTDKDPRDISGGIVPSLRKGDSLNEEIQGEMKGEEIRTGRRNSLDKENNTNLWSLILQHVKTDVPEKEESQLSAEKDTDGSIEKSSQYTFEGIHDKEADIPNPTSFELYESEAINLVQEAVNELLTLPEQTVSSHVQSNGNSTATQEEEKAPPIESLPNTYSKLSKVIMAKRFIKAMNKIRQLKSQTHQELSCSTDTDTKRITAPSLRGTATGEKNSWEEGMLDHALQKVVGKLAPAQKRRVASLVQAFETVGSQPVHITSQRRKAAIT